MRILSVVLGLMLIVSVAFADSGAVQTDDRDIAYMRNVEHIQNDIWDTSLGVQKTGIYNSSGTQIDNFGNVTPDGAVPTLVTPIGGYYETTPTSVDAGDVGWLAMTAYRYLKTAGYIDAENAQGVSVVNKGSVNSGYQQVIATTTLDGTPTFVAPTAVFVGNKDKVSWLIKTTFSVTDAFPTVVYTFEGSPDNSNWVTIDTIMASDGTDAPTSAITQTTTVSSETVNNTAYLPTTMQYVRLTCDSANTSAGNTAVVKAWIQWQNL